ncbi:MAG TPA: hypothetical protein VN112_10155 [Ensifer sp.]|nr:hypothetical protein [Ensifer sp.]
MKKIGHFTALCIAAAVVLSSAVGAAASASSSRCVYQPEDTANDPGFCEIEKSKTGGPCYCEFEDGSTVKGKVKN